MENVISQLSKYVVILFITLFTLYSFSGFKGSNKARQRQVFRGQTTLMFLVHVICYLILFMQQKELRLLYLYLAETALFASVLILYQMVYRNLSRLVLNNMLFLIMLSFVMLARLSYDLAFRQFLIVAASFLVSIGIPFVIQKFKYLDKLGWLYGGVGLILLLMVMAFGTTKYGATNWINVFGILIQPSEFVKILFVFFAAGLLAVYQEFIDLVKITVLAAAYVLVLVGVKDLGSALIFFLVYVIMLYVATEDARYLAAGLGSGVVAAVAAYFMFSHVQTRVLAWRDPWTYIDNQGYQVTQSLFAIGTGNWFGMGLGGGLPGNIPVVESDFIISAIAEELGVITAICIILVCLSCFIMFVNIAIKMKKDFYKLVALGLSVVYIFQVFLTIGGAIKFIPSTGVTLPLVSYGGSSALCTIITFSIIQGMYVLNQKEVDKIEKRRLKLEKTEKIQDFQ